MGQPAACFIHEASWPLIPWQSFERTAKLVGADAAPNAYPWAGIGGISFQKGSRRFLRRLSRCHKSRRTHKQKGGRRFGEEFKAESENSFLRGNRISFSLSIFYSRGGSGSLKKMTTRNRAAVLLWVLSSFRLEFTINFSKFCLWPAKEKFPAASFSSVVLRALFCRSRLRKIIKNKRRGEWSLIQLWDTALVLTLKVNASFFGGFSHVRLFGDGCDEKHCADDAWLPAGARPTPRFEAILLPA